MGNNVIIPPSELEYIVNNMTNLIKDPFALRKTFDKVFIGENNLTYKQKCGVSQSFVKTIIDLIKAEKQNKKYLSDLLAEIGYNLPYTITKTWTLQDIPKFSQLEKIRKYVEDVIKIIPLNDNTIVFPSTLNKMNYLVLNNLEKAMYVLTANIKSIKTAYKYSGEIYSGEE